MHRLGRFPLVSFAPHASHACVTALRQRENFRTRDGARSVPISIERNFLELVARDWRVAARFAVESGLVSLGRLHDRDRADSDLDRISQEDLSAPLHHRSSYRHLLPNDLGGALGLFFHVDLANLARLGRETLA